MGTSLLAVADESAEVADRVLGDLSEYLWKRRTDFEGTGVSLEDAIQLLKEDSACTCLLDMGDNIGGGSPADGTLIASELLKHQIPNRLSVSMIQRLLKGGGSCLGRKLTLAMGGKTDQLHGPPLLAQVEVIGIFEGKFEEKEARHGASLTLTRD